MSRKNSLKGLGLTGGNLVLVAMLGVLAFWGYSSGMFCPTLCPKEKIDFLPFGLGKKSKYAYGDYY